MFPKAADTQSGSKFKTLDLQAHLNPVITSYLIDLKRLIWNQG